MNAEIPPVLIMNSPEYLVKFDPMSHETELPGSYRAYIETRKLIRESFVLGGEGDDANTFDAESACWNEYNGLIDEMDEPGLGVMTEKQANANLTYIGSELERWIMMSLKRASDELDDVISYGNISCREWIMSLNNGKDKGTAPAAKKKRNSVV